MNPLNPTNQTPPMGSGPVKPQVIKELSNKFANMAFLCSILVVFIHVWPDKIAGDPTRWIMNSFKLSVCKIAVPFFFIAAGYFLAKHVNEQGWWWRECHKRIRSLVVPYVLWSFLFCIFRVCLRAIENRQAGLPFAQNISLSPSLILDAFIITFKPVNSPYLLLVLWFVGWLSILVASSCFYVFFLKRGRMFTWLYIGVTLKIRKANPKLKKKIACQLIYFKSKQFSRIDQSKTAHKNVKLNVLPDKKSYLVSAGCFVVGMGVFAVLLYGEYVGGWIFVGCLKMFAILPVLLSVWIIVPKRAWSANLTACAFPIYLLHLFMLDISAAISKKSSLFVSCPSLVVYIIWGVSAILACILFTHFIRFMFPRTANVLFGGR